MLVALARRVVEAVVAHPGQARRFIAGCWLRLVVAACPPQVAAGLLADDRLVALRVARPRVPAPADMLQNIYSMPEYHRT